MAQTTARGGGWRVKPMDVILSQAEEPAHKLKRAMGTISLTAFGVTAIIGSGIFALTGMAAATKAVPGIILYYGVAGIVTALAALCYPKLAGAVPIAGSSYTHS